MIHRGVRILEQRIQKNLIAIKIFDLQRTIQLMEQQIAQIEAAEQREAAARQHDKQQPAEKEKAGQ